MESSAESPKTLPTPVKQRKHRSTKTHYTLDSICALFDDEGCIVTSTEYRNVLSKIDYTFDGKPYSVQLYRWIKKGSRPHLPSTPKPKSSHKKYSAETIRQMFADEGCVLSMPDDWVYSMNQDQISYMFGGKEYTTTINRWVNARHRPHLVTPK
jgi:hypothetical protein